MNIVKDIRLLRRMEKAGLIELHPQTGKTVSHYGLKCTAWYIRNHEKDHFEYKGKKYEIQFMSGCFYPYVVEVEE